MIRHAMANQGTLQIRRNLRQIRSYLSHLVTPASNHNASGTEIYTQTYGARAGADE